MPELNKKAKDDEKDDDMDDPGEPDTSFRSEDLGSTWIGEGGS